MNTSALKSKLERLEVRRKKNGGDPAEIKITTCWGNEKLDIAPDVIHIVTKWGGNKLARGDEEEFDE
jgi:hypothetical protein